MKIKNFLWLKNLCISYKKWIPMSVYSFLFSFAVLAGRHVHYTGNMRGNISENYIFFGRTFILQWCVLFLLTFPCTMIIAYFIEKKRIKCINTPIKKKIFLIYWMIIFVCWLPYLLSYYPGGLVGDGACTLEYALDSGIPKSSHWGVMYILVLRLFLKIGTLISSDINVGVYCYVITECILFSGACALVAFKLAKHGFPGWVSWVTVIMYAVSGFFASYSITLWKDGLFSAAVTIFILLLWELQQEKQLSVNYYILFTLIVIFICFWRSNGVPVMILCTLGITVLLKRKGIKLVALCSAVVVFVSIIQGPVYDALEIKKDTLVESMSVPIQQIAAVINSEDDLTAEQESILYNMIPRDKWFANYCPTLSDDLKNSVDQIYFSEHISEFMRVWVELLPSHLKTYIKAYMMQTLGFWQPNVSYGNYFDYWLGVEDIFERGYSGRDLFMEFTGFSIQPVLSKLTFFIPSGSMVWILLYAVALEFRRENKKQNFLIILWPLVSCWAAIMLAAPIAYAYRYIFMLPLSLPIIIASQFEMTELGGSPNYLADKPSVIVGAGVEPPAGALPVQ